MQEVGGGRSEGGHDDVVVEEGRERVGTAQGTGMVQWGVAFLEHKQQQQEKQKQKKYHVMIGILKMNLALHYHSCKSVAC